MNKEKIGSEYLVACSRADEAQQKEILYRIFGPVVFGQRQAGSSKELDQLFYSRYGINVHSEFLEGDEHYEEYQEACQAIAEGMLIYGGEIAFQEDSLADLAEQVWERLEQEDRGGFRRINTFLED